MSAAEQHGKGTDFPWPCQVSTNTGRCKKTKTNQTKKTPTKPKPQVNRKGEKGCKMEVQPWHSAVVLNLGEQIHCTYSAAKLNANDSQSPRQLRPKTHTQLESKPLPAPAAIPQAESCNLNLPCPAQSGMPAQQHACTSIYSLRSYTAASVKEQPAPSMLAFKG